MFQEKTMASSNESCMSPRSLPSEDEEYQCESFGFQIHDLPSWDRPTEKTSTISDTCSNKELVESCWTSYTSSQPGNPESPPSTSSTAADEPTEMLVQNMFPSLLQHFRLVTSNTDQSLTITWLRSCIFMYLPKEGKQ